MVESADADAFSYDVGSPTSVKKILGEYLSGGCDNLSNLRAMSGLVALSVGVGVGVSVERSKAEPFDCAELIDFVRELSVTRETDLVLWVGPS